MILIRLQRRFRPVGFATAVAAVFCALCFVLPSGSMAFQGVVPNHPGTVPPTTKNWTRVLPTTAPSKRAGANLAYDVRDGYVLAFGGLGHVHPFNDTWVFSGGNWTELFPPVAPSPRAFAALAYDNATQQVILFGGQGAQISDILNDTWAYSGGNWTRLHPAQSPPGVYRALMVYDAAASEIVLYGGLAASGKTTTPNNQTWVFKAGTWSMLTRAGVAGTNPSAMAMAYYPVKADIVLVGEVSPTNATIQTWLFKDGAWQPLLTKSEPTRAPVLGQQDLVYDATDGYLLLFGSHQNTWNFSNGHWARLQPGIYPRGRIQFGMTFDGVDGYVVLFGGQVPLGRGCLACQYLNDTWHY
jgi:hypothetical protein